MMRSGFLLASILSGVASDKLVHMKSTLILIKLFSFYIIIKIAQDILVRHNNETIVFRIHIYTVNNIRNKDFIRRCNNLVVCL